MKLCDFSIKVSNVWNSMDDREGREFIKNRNQQVQNWRNIIYKDIEKDERHGTDPTIIPDDHFESIPPENTDKEEDKCPVCGKIVTDGECTYCKKEKKEKDEKNDKRRKVERD